MNPTIKNLLLFSAGMAVGIGGTYRYFKVEAERAITDETYQLREVYLNRVKNNEVSNKPGDPVELDLKNKEKQDEADKVQYNKILQAGEYSKSIEEEKNAMYKPKPERAAEDPVKIHPISEEEYMADDMDDYEKNEYEWFVDNQVLADQDDTPIHNPSDILGVVDPDELFTNPEDPDVAYVRNHEIGADFLIIRQHTVFQGTD